MTTAAKGAKKGGTASAKRSTKPTPPPTAPPPLPTPRAEHTQPPDNEEERRLFAALPALQYLMRMEDGSIAVAGGPFPYQDDEQLEEAILSWLVEDRAKELDLSEAASYVAPYYFCIVVGGGEAPITETFPADYWEELLDEADDRLLEAVEDAGGGEDPDAPVYVGDDIPDTDLAGVDTEDLAMHITAQRRDRMAVPDPWGYHRDEWE